MPVFLHAACGNTPKERTTRLFQGSDWREVRMAPSPAHKPDIVGTLLDMRSVADASFDAAFTAHSLERLFPHEVPKALANLLRALTPSGYLVLFCTDLQAVCKLVAEDKLLETAYEAPAGPIAPLDILYGYRPALAAGKSEYACRCGFTSRALLGTLNQAGFASVWAARNPETFSIAAIASKSRQSEEAMRRLAEQHFR